jgi:putative ABC transport system substrate-binding protein
VLEILVINLNWFAVAIFVVILIFTIRLFLNVVIKRRWSGMQIRREAFKFFLATTLVLLISITLLYFPNSKNQVEKIAVFQTLSHPALNLAKNGFKGEVNKKFDQRFEFVEYNAQGIVSQAQSIAKILKERLDIKLIFTIGTLATQVLVKAKPYQPVIFAAVTDPSNIGITNDSDNIFGITDEIDHEKQIKVVLKKLPDLKSISILYNQSEPNSLVQKERIKSAANKLGLKSFLFAVTAISDIAIATNIACKKTDALIIPTDNLLASAMPLLVKKAHALDCPVIASDVLLIEKGANLAVGVDYFEAGKSGAEIAEKLINEEVIIEKIIKPLEQKIAINK